jgi:hypothetical protein
MSRGTQKSLGPKNLWQPENFWVPNKPPRGPGIYGGLGTPWVPMIHRGLHRTQNKAVGI